MIVKRKYQYWVFAILDFAQGKLVDSLLHVAKEWITTKIYE